MSAPVQLAAAAARRRRDAEARVEKAISTALRRKVPITFAGISEAAKVSPDFLYRHPGIRAHIESLRKVGRAPDDPGGGRQPSNPVRVLARKLQDERASHRSEVALLKARLEAAHGELIELRASARRP